MKSQSPLEFAPELDGTAPGPEESTAALAIDQVRWLAFGALSLVRALHAERASAGDLTPEHFLITGAGEVLLADLPTAADSGATTDRTPRSAYRSPERRRGQSSTPASDQYALGAVIYELLAGRAPLKADEERPPALGTTLVDVRALRTDCPTFIGYAVMRMLATQPADRWESLDEVSDAFLGAIPSDGGATRAALAARVCSRASGHGPKQVDVAALVVSFAELAQGDGWKAAARTTPVRTRLVTPGSVTPAAGATIIKTPNMADEALRLVLPVGEAPRAHPRRGPRLQLSQVPRPALAAAGAAALVAVLGGLWAASPDKAAEPTAELTGWSSSASRTVLPTPSAEPLSTMDSPRVYPGGPLAADSAARAAKELERAVVAMLDSVSKAGRERGRQPGAPTPPAPTPALASAPAAAVRTPEPRPPATQPTAPAPAVRPASTPVRNETTLGQSRQALPPSSGSVVTREDPVVVAAEAAFSQPSRGVTTAAPTAPRPTPVTAPPVTPPTTLPSSALTGSAPVFETPTAAEVRAQASRVATRQRMATAFGEFVAGGDDFTVSMVGAPTVTENAPGRAKARFDVRLTRFDAAGRRTSRLTTVTMDVTKQNGVVGTAAVALGALREP